MKTEYTVDKTSWPAGIWNFEPDFACWVDDETQFTAMIVRNDITGTLNGYAGVGKESPLYGIEYDELDVGVHGGLTFSGLFRPKKGSLDFWYFGLDCAHADDAMPKPLGIGRHTIPMTGVYRDFTYVKDQITALAAQLKNHEGALKRSQ